MSRGRAPAGHCGATGGMRVAAPERPGNGLPAHPALGVSFRSEYREGALAPACEPAPSQAGHSRPGGTQHAHSQPARPGAADRCAHLPRALPGLRRRRRGHGQRYTDRSRSSICTTTPRAGCRRRPTRSAPRSRCAAWSRSASAPSQATTPTSTSRTRPPASMSTRRRAALRFAIGDSVTINGTIAQYRGLTEITLSTYTVHQTGAAVPQPLVVTCDDVDTPSCPTTPSPTRAASCGSTTSPGPAPGPASAGRSRSTTSPASARSTSTARPACQSMTPPGGALRRGRDRQAVRRLFPALHERLRASCRAARRLHLCPGPQILEGPRETNIQANQVTIHLETATPTTASVEYGTTANYELGTATDGVSSTARHRAAGLTRRPSTTTASRWSTSRTRRRPTGSSARPRPPGAPASSGHLQQERRSDARHLRAGHRRSESGRLDHRPHQRDGVDDRRRHVQLRPRRRWPTP